MNECLNSEVGKVKSSEGILFSFLKRLFDICCSILGLILLIPSACIIKIINVIHGDFGSIVYSQTRIGKNGKTFKLYKYRSMVLNADEMLKELLKKEPYKTEWEEYQKLKDDPRITKVGKILRKTSCDELPQMISILKGDMSFIGPRPLVPGELEEHGGNTQLYNSVKPGLTGWWACNGRSNIDYKERLDLEYYYCKNASLKLDIKIFFETIKIVFLGKGVR